jgi:hypothetical protein
MSTIYIIAAILSLAVSSTASQTPEDDGINTHIAKNGSCTFDRKYPCVQQGFTTATIVDSQDYNKSVHACTYSCNDGCCFVFDPANRVSVDNVEAIVGWCILATFTVIAIVLLFKRNYFAERTMDSVSINNKYNADKMTDTIGVTEDNREEAAIQIPEAITNTILESYKLSRKQVLDTVKNRITEAAITTFSTGVAILLGCLLYGTTKDSRQLVGVQYGTAIRPLAYYLWSISAVLTVSAVWLISSKSVIAPKTAAQGTAKLVAAVLLILFMPVIGGYDGVSGLAFTDGNALTQVPETNKTRYNTLLGLANTLLALAATSAIQGSLEIVWRAVSSQ